MTKLLRNGVLVAEGRASRDLDSGVLFFGVKRWHARDPDTVPWMAHRAATWTVDDGVRSADYAGTTLLIGCFRDEIRSLTIDAADALGDPVSLDVR